MKCKILSVSFLSGILASSIASAELNIYAQVDVDNKEKRQYSFSQVGLSSERAKVVNGFGREMPLQLATEIIVPAGWGVHMNPGATDQLVDWQGGLAWPYVLQNMAKKNSLRVLIDWERRSVDLYSVKAEEERLAALAEVEAKKKAEEAALAKAEEEKKAAAEAAAKEEEMKAKQQKFVVGNSDNSSLEIKDYLEADKIQIDEFKTATFVLSKGRTLKQNLDAWSRVVGWQLEWQANADYRVTTEVKINGTFFDVVPSVLSYYRSSKRPLSVKFYTKNKVILVENQEYIMQRGK